MRSFTHNCQIQRINSQIKLSGGVPHQQDIFRIPPFGGEPAGVLVDYPQGTLENLFLNKYDCF
jgi:hypothetical protein